MSSKQEPKADLNPTAKPNPQFEIASRLIPLSDANEFTRRFMVRETPLPFGFAPK